MARLSACSSWRQLLRPVWCEWPGSGFSRYLLQATAILQSVRHGSYSGVFGFLILQKLMTSPGMHAVAGSLGSRWLLIMVSLLLFGGSLFAAVTSMRAYNEDDRLNVAATAVSMGLSAVSAEGRDLWPPAYSDPYRRVDFPRTVDFLRQQHKLIWSRLPALGTILSPSHQRYRIYPEERPVASGLVSDRCSFAAVIDDRAGGLSRSSVIATVVTTSGIVRGYGVLTRDSPAYAARTVRGYMLCIESVKIAGSRCFSTWAQEASRPAATLTASGCPDGHPPSPKPPGRSCSPLPTSCRLEINYIRYGSDAVTERSKVTARSYRRFRCRACWRQFNERSGACARSSRAAPARPSLSRWHCSTRSPGSCRAQTAGHDPGKQYSASTCR